MKSNQKGFSLVEVLAVILISFIVMSLFSGIVVNSVNSHKKQTQDTQQIFDKMYALKIITKDLRKMKSPDYLTLDSNDTRAFIKPDENEPAVEYFVDDGKLFKGDSILANRIKSFEITKNGDLVSISLSDEEGTLTTEIILRR